MTAIRHISELGHRPPVGVPRTPPRMTRAELGAAALNRPGTPANASHLVDLIVSAFDALSIIDARRLPDGTLSKRDQLDYDQRSAPLSRWFQMIGLYPADGAE
jgi:hypothetical protein